MPRSRRLCILPSDTCLGPADSLPSWIHRLSTVNINPHQQKFKTWFKSVEKEDVSTLKDLKKIYSYLNDLCFDSLLSEECSIEWSNKLKTSSGVTKIKNQKVIIALSTKVIRTVGQFISTLLHEMCHVGQFTISRAFHPSHGEYFHKWLNKVKNRLPFIEVSVTHNFFINSWPEKSS